MDAVKFLEELHRMCLATDGCRTCAIRHAGDYCPSYLPKIEETVATVEKWSAEHPKKTRLQDFLEKHPNALVDKNGVPFMRPATLGYCDVKECEWCKQYYVSSCICWNLPLEE